MDNDKEYKETDKEANKAEELSEEERRLIENAENQKDKVKRGRKKTVDKINGRERANSLSLIEYFKENAAESTNSLNKRKRDEIEIEAREAFKKR